MRQSIKEISFDITVVNNKKFLLKIFRDPLGKKEGLFSVKEPGKANDDIILDEDAITALKRLLTTNKEKK